MQNPHFASKIKIPKYISKSILQTISSCSVKKKSSKKTNYSRNEIILKNRPLWKGYSPCKILILDQKLELQKTCENPFYKSVSVSLCEKLLQKTRNIREMRSF